MAKIGRQTPTQSFKLPYRKTKGKDAIDLYQKTGRKAQKWQILLVKNILALNKDKLWVHTKYGYSVPRRNGKNEVVAIREMYGLQQGESILHTAHRTTTSRAAWERLKKLFDEAGIQYKACSSIGLENIRMLDNNGRIDFRTRSSKSGLGEGFDLLVIDEAQEYQEDQEAALKYVVSDSHNPQTIFCGTPPTPTSSGTVFMNLRDSILGGSALDSGWAEWSVEKQTDPHDRKAWYETNPSLGTILTERKILAEIGPDEVDFNIQRLGFWIRYNLKSAVSKAEWEELKAPKLPMLIGRLHVGVKFGKDGTNVALSVAVHTQTEKIFVESIDCRPARNGVAWIIEFLSKADVEQVVIDGANGQQILADAMKEHKLIKPILPTVKEVIVANATFEQMLTSKMIMHMNQLSLTQSVSNCEKREIGSNGGFGYKSISDNSDIALMESMILALWSCSCCKVKGKQKISY
jgi:phage terminase large subunit-like protein